MRAIAGMARSYRLTAECPGSRARSLLRKDQKKKGPEWGLFQVRSGQ